MRARATVSARIVRKNGLTFRSNPNPHPAHYDMDGWPEEKEAKKAITVELAASAQVEVRPENR